MTKENQEIRDKLKTAEHIITNALASQPDDNEKCHAHLCKAVEDVSDAISTEIGEKKNG